VVQPSRIFSLWQRLYSRFLIEPFPAEGGAPSVSTTIQPMTDADELLRAYGLIEASTASFDADGEVIGLIVPAGERYRVWGYSFSRTSGDRSIDATRLADASFGGSMTIEAYTGTASREVIFPEAVVLEESDGINLIADGGAAATVYRLQVWASVEAAY